MSRGFYVSLRAPGLRWRHNPFFGRFPLNLLDFNLRSGRGANVKDRNEKVVVGLQVDVPAAELKERLERAARQADARIDALRARLEEGKIQAEDMEDLDRQARMDLDDYQDMPAKKVRRAALRRLEQLRDARDQLAFLASHVILLTPEGEHVVYRLDAEDARRLVTLHVDVDG